MTNQTKKQKVIYYILLVLVSAIFLVSAYAKLTGNASAEAAFTVAHLPIWFMYFIGVAELCGAVGLWIRSLQIYAASGLFIILAGAVVVTAIYVSVPEALFPLGTAIALGIILKCRG
ncbi:MAG: DoxX family protein [Candidatus Pacebacteria bacterium]|nr:DoxX family protein [Candidatus Paceibacterota bacterium]